MVLLRSDGTPTYMLSVVVDDHDMAITHVIRGDDHLTNTFRQVQLYQALDWSIPSFAHIPLIHGPDGAKLSKRHGALGVDAYRDLGYLPEALRNYLLRLGWAHGDDEIISTEQAIEWFDLDAVGRSPARFDFAKLDNLNGHYLRLAENSRLTALVLPRIEKRLGRAADTEGKRRLEAGMSGLKERAKTLEQLADSAVFYSKSRPLELEPKAAALLTAGSRAALGALLNRFDGVPEWTASALEAVTRVHAQEAGIKLGDIAQPLRATLTGQTTSPPIFEVAEVLGRAETLARIKDIAT
jgi:glutamyl-tRNA synthetase